MPSRAEPAAPLAAIAVLIAQRVAPADRDTLARFARDYFAGVDPDDIASFVPADLYGAMLSHWSLARRRGPGATLVRIGNPALATDGWQSRHTVIEVVNDDMPFLVDSVTMAIRRHGLTPHLILHPILSVARDADGSLTRYLGTSDGGMRESWIHVEVDRLADPAARERLQADLERTLADVRAAVDDWVRMLARLREVIDDLDHLPASISGPAADTARAFLDWLAHNHFTLLGYRSHDLVTVDAGIAIRAVGGSGLGILRDDAPATATPTPIPAHLARHVDAPEVLVITKSGVDSTVHRPGRLDYVGVKRFDAAGRVVGEHRFLGLFTSTAYNTPPANVPILAAKVNRVLDAAGYARQSHAGKSLAHVLDTYPRDELFQIDDASLLANALAILHLAERPRVRLIVRPDRFERYVTCLVFAPREVYTTDLRRRWQDLLLAALRGHACEFDLSLSQSALARVLFTIHTTPGALPAIDVQALEASLAQAARRWEDDLRDALAEQCGEARGHALHRRFGAAFPVGYREDFAARAAVADVELLEATVANDAPGLALYRPIEAPAGTVRFKLVVRSAPVALSDSLPMLERLGFRVLDERPYRFAPESTGATPSPSLWMHDIGLAANTNPDLPFDALRPVFLDAFAAVFAGRVENDDLNRLVAAIAMPVADIVILRAYARWFRQIGFALSQAFIEATLVTHAPIAVLLVALFKARFDPAGTDDGAAISARITAALDAVTNLNEDRVLRQFLAAILGTTRTNFFVRDAAGEPRAFLSFKVDPSRVPGIPDPRPMFEIFVYAPRFEGVHLRGGKVARGGLRWSDRPEDFRTEVLGLVKAQMVKNTVIVPVGSKGGFVLKRAPSDRDGLMREGVACYQDFLRGLLDLTDNLAAGAVVPPRGVRRHDADDPYLVVAADKGTATFSDYANAISAEYGFWLGDAFASGGSAGYDHKAMAITARGAWESTQRHARELGLHIDREPFTAVGVGDMSGDVFGNGLLLSRTVRLVAAFDHRHIFVDPEPDPATSFAERERLFRLPRSSWADYDPARLSPGGGVWPRTAKAIPVSAQMREALGISAPSLTPQALASAILLAPVDLLYNGGIGTFVKATTESHADAGDRTNDGLRVNGRALRCRMVVEGGNLGFTQRGRIEYALAGGPDGAGGRINTDAIDNSGGVETSDHEVNIKILLGTVIADGELTLRQRDTLLVSMTDEVAKLVLRDNYFQNQSLALARRTARDALDGHTRFIRFLEKAGRLDRAIEHLPTDEEIAERRRGQRGLTVPELAVLLAYSKIWLNEALVDSTLPDDPWIATALDRYFPKVLAERFGAWLPRHPLRREIIATHVTNSMINRVGSIFVHRLTEATGATPAEVVRAYLLAREVFGYVDLWQAVEALDGQVSEDVLAGLLLEAQRQPPATSWFLRSPRLREDMGPTITRFREGVATLAQALPDLLDAPALQRRAEFVARHVAQGVPEALAARVASFRDLGAALDLVEVAGMTGQPLLRAARLYFALGDRLGLAWFTDRIERLPEDGHWLLQVKIALRDDLAGIRRSLTADLAKSAAPEVPADVACADWIAAREQAVQRATRLADELREVTAPDATMLSVALRELRGLAGG